MPLDKLSDVTDTLINLIQYSIDEKLPNSVTVVDQSPEQIKETEKVTISVYLYHAQEDAHYKNADAPGGTVANTPLALSLYYVVTAHRIVDDEPVPRAEQEYLGYALKILHDTPIVTKNTQVGVQYPMPDPMREGGNKLQIIYRPVSPEDAMTFWNGDDERLIRFSAFYEVRVVFMRPEAQSHIPGYVLSVGNYVLPTGVMAITSSESVVRFTPPGGPMITLTASPARVALSSFAPPGEAPNNQLTLRGTRLGGGQLVLRSPLFETTNNKISVDADLNADWSIYVTPNRLVARINKILKRPGLPDQLILPGIYGASVEVISQYELPGGLTKTIVTRSNEVAIAVTPYITGHVGTIDDGPPPIVVDIDVDPQTELDAPDLTNEIAVVVGGKVYADDPGLGPGEFIVSTPAQLKIGTHFNSSDPGIYPVRLIVRGAEAPPYWIEVP